MGADVGITRFVRLSNDTHIAPHSPYKELLQSLAKAQRQMARKVRFSRNWKKAKA